MKGRTCVAVLALPLGANVEIEMIAKRTKEERAGNRSISARRNGLKMDNARLHND